MLVSKIRVGMRINGVLVVSLKRISTLSRITLADGTERTEHKGADIPRVTVALAVPAGPVRFSKSYAKAPRIIRASTSDWRGESDGRRGERVTAKMQQWGA